MQDTTKTLTDLFYFMPNSITFKTKEQMINTLQDEARQSIYLAFGITLATELKSFNAFLRKMKDHIEAKVTPQGYIITKKDSFKTLVEKSSNQWSSKYKDLLTKLSKRVIVMAISYGNPTDLKTVSESENIRKVAEMYSRIDPQVSEWLYKLAGMKDY